MGVFFYCIKNKNNDPIIDKITNDRKTYIVKPPNNSKDPKPKAKSTIPNKGTQQGDVITVNTIPITPMRSSILFFHHVFLLLKNQVAISIH